MTKGTKLHNSVVRIGGKEISPVPNSFHACETGDCGWCDGYAEPLVVEFRMDNTDEVRELLKDWLSKNGKNKITMIRKGMLITIKNVSVSYEVDPENENQLLITANGYDGGREPLPQSDRKH